MIKATMSRGKERRMGEVPAVGGSLRRVRYSAGCQPARGMKLGPAAMAWLFILAVFLGASIACRPQPAEKPNFLIILTDDQRHDTMAAMPQTVSLIFDQGIAFQKAYVTTARCCPSRSTILTGQYAHTHGVLLNSDQLTGKTVVETLKENGYRTGLVGKYLNSYPTRAEDPPRPEFDEWIGMISGADGARYTDTSLNVNGVWQQHTGYQTFILLDYVLNFLRQSSGEASAPFFLMFSPYAPHLPAQPAPGDESLFADIPPHNPPNFNPAEMSGKPAWLQSLSALSDEQIASIQNDRLNMLRSLNAVDEAVAQMISELDSLGELDNTVVIFLSDNGFFWGEHRLATGKIYAYEESSRIPMAIRYPQLIKEPRVDDHLVANIDIAPTLLDLAGIESEGMDGLSLAPLLRGESNPSWREDLLLEGWPINVAYVGNSPPFQAVHRGDAVYVETENDTPELYILSADPYQLVNEVDNPEHADLLSEMRRRLEAYRLEIPAR